jgi:diguanylate cyclase (GGDEF)-like protein
MDDGTTIRLGGPTRPLVSAADRLLETRRPDAARSLSSRERVVEGVAALGFILAAAAMAVLLTPSGSVYVAQAGALVLTFAALGRIRFAVGSGFMMPTQLALVPILLLLPPGLAPALVGVGLLLTRASDVFAGRAPAERLIATVADGWYVVPPALLLALVDPLQALTGAGWPVWIAALALQLGSDLVFSTIRESLGTGVEPTIQASVVGRIAIVDVLLSPVGLLAALASQSRPFAFLLVLPLVVGFNLFARDRAARIARALALVDDLDLERERVLAAQRRIGETAAANLDRSALERIIVATAVELIGADGGRLSAADSPDGPVVERAGSGGDRDLADVLAAVEESLGEKSGFVEATASPAAAIGLSLDVTDGCLHVLAVARRAGGFSPRERELLGTLAEQASVCLQNLALHERMRHLAGTDELTGLLNHRRLQEVLAQEVRSAERYRTPLALVMLDIDDFKQVNDRYGHQQGDEVLRAVADVVRSSVREVDFPARYGGEELAVALPHMDLEGASALAERIRGAIAAAQVQGPGGRALSVTASVGVAELDRRSPSRQALVAAADAALYRAKRAGKNRVELDTGVYETNR